LPVILFIDAVGGDRRKMTNKIAELRLTVTPAYLPAAAVTIHSFVKQNPWFEGNVVVYATEGDVETVRERLRGLNHEVRPISTELTQSIHAACADGAWVLERFLSLAMLAEPADGAVLLADADLLFQKPCEELEQTEGQIVGCPEGAAHMGLAVHRTTNEMLAEADPRTAIGRTFNSGLLRVSSDLLGPQLFEEARLFVTSERLDLLVRRQHDQFVLNRLFEGLWTELSASYNYLLGHASVIHATTGLRLADAHVLHFNHSLRPWAQGMIEVEYVGVGETEAGGGVNHRRVPQEIVVAGTQLCPEPLEQAIQDELIVLSSHEQIQSLRGHEESSFLE